MGYDPDRRNMVNRGVAPLNPQSEVGQFRVRAGDTEYAPLDPPEPGVGDYKFWSDAEIEVYLAVNDSQAWAIYEAYLQLASAAAVSSKEVSDYDLKVNTAKRADQLLAIARAWRDRADDEDGAGGVGDIFELFDTVPRCNTCELCESRTCYC